MKYRRSAAPAAGLPAVLIAAACVVSCGGPGKTVPLRTSSIPVMEAPLPAAPVAAPAAQPPAPAVPEKPAEAVAPAPAMAAAPAAADIDALPVLAPPDLAAWAREAARGENGEEQPEEGASDDYNELVGPFDEDIIREIEKPAAAQAEQPAAEAQPPAAPAVVYDIPIELNQQVLGYIQLFQTVRRESFEFGLARSRIYEKRMKAILAEEGVPADLYYLCLIESAFNPKAYSRARAMGPWQFIESTGRLYSLTRDWWFDERRDPDKSTRAAARHLRDLYAELGSWPLALASYNAGMGYVKKMMAKQGTADFWSLKLVSQTRNYVPAFMAATIIAKEPEKYGFQLAYQPPLEYERVTVDECTDLEVIADCAGVTVEEIRALNPELLRWCTPPMLKGFAVAVPAGTGERFAEKYAQIPREKKVAWRRYLIAPGDSLSLIAAKFGAPVPVIQEVNGLKKSTLIIAGNYLLIPVPGQASAITGEQARKVVTSVAPPPAEAAGARTRLSYRVRPGDTLWDIALRHGVTVEELRSWNAELQGDILFAGNLLTVWSSRRAEPATTQAAGGAQRFTYLVKKGDTLWGIARRFEKGVDDICRANGFHPTKLLYPGDSITIPGTDNL